MLIPFLDMVFKVVCEHGVYKQDRDRDDVNDYDNVEDNRVSWQQQR